MRPEYSETKAETETKKNCYETETKIYETETSLVMHVIITQIGMLYYLLHI